MPAVPFDDSARCLGCISPTRGTVEPICCTCQRLSLRQDVPLLQGKVYRITEKGEGYGTSDCKDWKAHTVTVPPRVGGGISLDSSAETNETGAA